MPIYETYSERKRRLANENAPDVYIYALPAKVRQQVIHLWADAFGSEYQKLGVDTYELIEKTISASEGQMLLGPKNLSVADRCRLHLLSGTTDQALDIIEFSAILMSRHDSLRRRSFGDDLNHRFRQNSIGYQFEQGQIIKIDDQFVHSEIVKPALSLLASDPIFKTADDHFMKAHTYYRAGDNEHAVTMAGTAFESVLKAICAQKGWLYDKGARATDLIKIVNANGLFPDYLDRGFDCYIAAMKTGLPGVRNDASSSHGKLPNSPKAPDYIAAYAIHLSAANIVLAIEASKGRQTSRVLSGNSPD